MDNSTQQKWLKLVGHRLRRPLVSIVDTANLITSGIEGDVSPQIYEDIKQIHTNAIELLGLMDSLLELAKIASQGADETLSNEQLVQLGIVRSE